MPNSVRQSSIKRYIEFTCYFFLILFLIPIKIKHKDEEEQFQEYILNFNKSYNSSEYAHRFEAFKHSLQSIESMISKNNGNAQFGLTKYSDLFPEEFFNIVLLPDLNTPLRRILLPKKFSSNSLEEDDVIRIKQNIKNIPEKIDWREKGAVTEPKNQKSCSGCWAFAAVGMIESLNAIKTGTLESLSVQNIIDCAPFSGCDGGNVCALLSWMKMKKFKIHKESEYPLTLTNGKCKNDTLAQVYINDFICKDFVGSEEEILNLLALNGPVAVAINALPWQNYIGGTIQFHCDGNPSKLNHAVAIVGYDLTKDVPHYIVKNSWGTDFGDNGFLYIAIGKNMCGLAYEVAAATV